MTITDRIIQSIRDVPDFPKPGIIFKDITPLLKDVQLSSDITQALKQHWENYRIDAIVGIESRGFIWGNSLAQAMKIPFIPVRKKGKLPAETFAHSYDLEYGSAEVEIHADAFEGQMNVLIHDDLLATGGTAVAAAELVKRAGGKVAGFSFLVELSFLNGAETLKKYKDEIHSLVSF